MSSNTVASAELLLEYSVAPYVRRLIDTPTLVVLADQDDFTMWDLEVDAFNAIPTPRKQLLVIPRTSHHELYRDPAKLQLAAAACRDWFTTHLGGG